MKKNTDTMIAIDGPAASGKSTLAEHLVKELGYLYLDTGVMYRAVTVAALNAGVDPNNEDAVSDLAEKVKIDIRPATIQDGRAADVLLDGEDITWSVRSQDVEANVSQVSAYKRVREVLTETQRKIAARGKIIMAGRDIGTVVLPDAKHKIYLDASVEERAKRRHNELVCRGEKRTYEEILDALKKRDIFDSSREIAPLRAADDAVILNSDGMDIDHVVQRALEIIDQD